MSKDPDWLLQETNASAVRSIKLVNDIVDGQIKLISGMLNSQVIIKNANPRVAEETVRAMKRFTLLRIALANANQLENVPVEGE